MKIKEDLEGTHRVDKLRPGAVFRPWDPEGVFVRGHGSDGDHIPSFCPGSGVRVLFEPDTMVTVYPNATLHLGEPGGEGPQ